MLIKNKTIIPAQIIPGMGVAHRNLVLQLPHFKTRFPEITSCWHGTLNLKLNFPIKVINFDWRSPPIAWTPSGKTKEIFDFIRIELEHNQIKIPAWIYIAHNSPHYDSPILYEVMTSYIEYETNRFCNIHINTDMFNFYC